MKGTHVIKTNKQPKKSGQARQPAIGDVLTLAEAAAYLRLSVDDVLQLIAEQGLPARRLGNEWRMLKSAIDKWLSQEFVDTGKAAQLDLAGAWKDDPLVDEELQEIYRNRGRPQ
jgi:excisionase family DNA binding protein